MSRPSRSRWAALVGAAAALAMGVGLSIAAPAAAAAPTTIVSLTFDDGNADQLPAANTLAANGLRGTFFINSGFLNAPGYLTDADVKSLVAAGHEIGGHTVSHPSLPAISTAEASRQVCLDRANLTKLGATVTDFAYPFADESTAVERIVQNCGYNSARGLGDLKSRFGCDDCDYAETTRPANAYDTAALDEVESDWTLQDLQNGVLNASSTGGWVQYTFHHICDPGACADPQVSTTLYNQFVQWLGQRVKAAGSTTVVKTVAQVINKPAKAVVQPAYPAPAAAGVNAIKNPGLETVDATTAAPACYLKGGYGANTAAFSTSSAAHGGAVAEQVTVTGYSDGDAKLLPSLDLGDCAPTVVPGRTYSLREWYRSTAVTQFAVYLRTSSGAWQYWTSSPWFAASATFANATWTTPAIPAGYNGISFGLNIFANGTLTTDDYALYDSTGAPAAALKAGTARTSKGVAPKRFPGQERRGAVQVTEGAHE